MPFSVHDNVDHPVSLYAATKKSNELMAHCYSHLFGIPTTGLRFFTVYGPWGRPDMSPHIFTKAIIAGDKVPVFNNGNMKRDFTFVDDIVEGVLGALGNPPEREGKKAPHRVLNIGNSKSEKLMDFIDTIQSAIGKDADIEFFPMQPGDVHETYADTAETARITGFKAKTSISEGIPRFVEWYKEYYKVDL